MFEIFSPLTSLLPEPAWWHIPLAGLALFYVGAPILVLTSVRARRETKVSEFDPEMAPDEVREDWRSMAAALEQQGFEPPFWLRIDGPVGDGWNAVQMQVDPGNGVVAGHFCLLRPGGTVQLTYHELMTCYRPYCEVVTNNSPQPPAFARVPEKTIISLPEVKEPSALYRAHLANVQLHGRGQLDFTTRERLLVELADDIRKDLERQVERGYFRLAGDEFRPTFKGAFLMTWKLLFPWKGFNKRARAAEGKALLQLAG